MITIKPIIKLDRNLIAIKPIIKAAGIAGEAGRPVALWVWTTPAARHAAAAGSREAGPIAIREPTIKVAGSPAYYHVSSHPLSRRRDRGGRARSRSGGLRLSQSRM